MDTLTNEQLCTLAQSGDRQAVSRLIEANLPFIRQTANQIIGSPARESYLCSCGIETDDLIQAGSIGLWKAVAGYDFSSGHKFLTYAAPAIKRAMIDLIRQYSQDKNVSGEIVSLNDVHNDSIRNLMMLPSKTQPEQIYIEQEIMEELHEAMDALPDRENVYVQYRFSFADSKGHPLTETAQYFHLTESRAKSVERSALKLLRHELFFEIPERAYARAEDKLTKALVAAGELHAVEVRLKSQKKQGKKKSPQSTNILRTATVLGANFAMISRAARRRSFCWPSGIRWPAIGLQCGRLSIFKRTLQPNCRRNLC